MQPNTQHRFKIKWKPQKSNFLSREYIAAAVAWETPVECRVRFEQKLMALWLRGKRATHGGGVGPIYRVTWCRMVLYTYSIAYSLHCWFPYTGGRVSSISDSPISCHTGSEILSRRKSKRQRSLVWTRYRDIWNKILAVSRPQIWTQWWHDLVFFWRPEICNNLCHLEVSQVSLWGCRPN